MGHSITLISLPPSIHRRTNLQTWEVTLADLQYSRGQQTSTRFSTQALWKTRMDKKYILNKPLYLASPLPPPVVVPRQNAHIALAVGYFSMISVMSVRLVGRILVAPRQSQQYSQRYPLGMKMRRQWYRCWQLRPVSSCASLAWDASVSCTLRRLQMGYPTPTICKYRSSSLRRGAAWLR